MTKFLYLGIFFAITYLAIIAFCFYNSEKILKNHPLFSNEFQNKEHLEKLIPLYLLIVFIILPIFILLQDDFENFWFIWVAMATYISLYFVPLYFVIRKSLKKQSPKFEKGLDLIESEKIILRVRGLKLLAQLLQQQIFVDEINSHTIYIDLKNANLANAKLSEVDLTGTNLSNAILTKADLSKTNLSKVNFSKAVLDKTNLLNATNIDQATFNDIIMTDVKMNKSTFNQFKTALSEQQQSKLIFKEDGETILVTILKN